MYIKCYATSNEKEDVLISLRVDSIRVLIGRSLMRDYVYGLIYSKYPNFIIQGFEILPDKNFTNDEIAAHFNYQRVIRLSENVSGDVIEKVYDYSIFKPKTVGKQKHENR